MIVTDWDPIDGAVETGWPKEVQRTILEARAMLGHKPPKRYPTSEVRARVRALYSAAPEWIEIRLDADETGAWVERRAPGLLLLADDLHKEHEDRVTREWKEGACVLAIAAAYQSIFAQAKDDAGRAWRLRRFAETAINEALTVTALKAKAGAAEGGRERAEKTRKTAQTKEMQRDIDQLHRERPELSYEDLKRIVSRRKPEWTMGKLKHGTHNPRRRSVKKNS